MRDSTDSTAAAATAGGRVLIVDPDGVARSQVALAARSAGMETASASTLAEGLAMPAWQPSRVIVALALPDGDAIMLLRRLGERGVTIPVAVMADAGVADDLRWPEPTRPDAVFVYLPDQAAVARWLGDIHIGSNV